MSLIRDHEYDCRRLCGQPWTEVHVWLDEFYAEEGPAHRKRRHHQEGIEEVRAKWGDEAAEAARYHILADCGWVPSRQDYETGAVDAMGIRPGDDFAEAWQILKGNLW